MRISLFSQCFFFIGLLSTFCLTDFTLGYVQCLKDQKHLLLELKNDFEFVDSRSTKLVQWNGTENCCTWNGVECDGAGHVISLQLDREGISDGLKESSSLFSLSYLEKLNLAQNIFFFIEVPRRISNLTHLTHLNLSDAGFSGQVPFELSFMQRLVSLDLTLNYLKIKNPKLKSLVHNLTNLRELILDEVIISSKGNEWCHVMSSSLPQLRILSLQRCGLSGPLDLSPLQLHSLSILRLDQNYNLSISRDFVANFSRLTTLSLFDCSLQGIFPEMIFQVPTLEFLDLTYNSLLNGALPEFHPNNSFRTIMLGETNFSGSLPNSISNLRMLSKIDLSKCRFTGSIPSFYMSKNLRTIDLSSNSLTGSLTIPLQSLFDLPLLETLILADNQLNGQIPEFNKNLSKLRRLDLSNNKITGKIPRNFWEIGNEKLEYLNLSHNLQKPYHIPPSVKMIDLNSNQLQVDLSSNQLQGELPILPYRVWYVDFSNNNFEKLIPPNFVPINSSITFLSIANNSLSGVIPTSLCNASNLRILDLSVNNLSGSIPPCLVENMMSTTLLVLNLERNNISGVIPNKFPFNCSLQTLDLSYNNLGGNIPVSLENCKSLEVMNVGNNNIKDIFPCMLWPSLSILVLRSNKFHGHLRCQKGWSNLQIIDIASNNFSGYLNSGTLLSWRGMMRNVSELSPEPRGVVPLGSNYYHAKVTLVVKGQELEFSKILTILTSMDFSCNNFQGGIPKEIGQLNFLYILNLSHNSLSGTIPKSIGNLTQLGSMDFSVNHLTGAIPQELAALTFLSLLNLSYNKLVGPIPSGNQLQTFSEASFEGNSGLCGFPLNKTCKNMTENGDKINDLPSNQRSEIEWDYVAAALGFVVGLGSIIWLLFGFRTLSEKFSERVDGVLEKLFARQDRRRRQRGRVLRNQVVRRH